MDGEKATDGGLERGSHPLFAAVIAVGEGEYYGNNRNRLRKDICV